LPEDQLLLGLEEVERKRCADPTFL
jgi:hypothetical protein